MNVVFMGTPDFADTVSRPYGKPSQVKAVFTRADSRQAGE